MATKSATASVMEGEESRQMPLVQLSLLALGLGVVTGFGAVIFRVDATAGGSRSSATVVAKAL